MTSEQAGKITALRRRSVVVAKLILVAAISVTGLAAFGATANDPWPDACNRNTAEAASIQFSVPDGPAVHKHVPGLGISPELDIVAEPVEVVVFSGPHHAVPIFPALQQGDNAGVKPVFENVVCVLTPSGEEMFYANVDLADLRLDGLTVNRRGP